MGIHYPFNYTGFETAFATTFVDLIDRFCSGCHTNDDVNGDCTKCPVGNLIYAAKDYVLNSYESIYFAQEAIALKKIKREIKNMIPAPLFNSQCTFSKKRGKDELLKLREAIKDLEFVQRQFSFGFQSENRVCTELLLHAKKEAEKKRKRILDASKKKSNKT